MKTATKLFTRDLPIQITIGNLLAIGLSLASVPVIARALGPDGRGVTAAVIAAYVFVPVLLGLGLPLELRRLCAHGIKPSSVRAARDLLLVSFVPAITLAALSVVTIFRTQTAEVRLAALIGLALAPFALSWAVDTAALVGSGRYRGVFVVRITQPSWVLVSAIGLWASGRLVPETVLYAFVIGNVLTAALGWSLVRVGLRGERDNRLSMLKASVAYAGSAVAESANAKLDQVLVLPLIGAAQTGYYTVAVSVATIPMALGHALAAESFRRMAAAESPMDRDRVLRVETNQAISLLGPFILAFAFVSAPMIPIVFGSNFTESIPVLLLLLPGSLCMTVAYVLSMLLAAQGRAGAMTLTQVTAVVTNLVVLVPLGMAWDARGVAVASTIAYGMLVALQWRALGVTVRGVVPSWRGTVGAMRSLLARQA